MAADLVAGVLDPRALRESNISAPASKACRNYYIASIGSLPDVPKGLELLLRGATEQQLQLRLAALNQVKAITLLARPATPEGLRLVTKFTFTKMRLDLRDEDAIWTKKLQKGELGNLLLRKPSKP